MDFGNPKELRFFNDLRPIPGSEAFGKGRRGGGGHIVTDFVTRVMRPKYLLKKSDKNKHRSVTNYTKEVKGSAGQRIE